MDFLFKKEKGRNANNDDIADDSLDEGNILKLQQNIITEWRNKKETFYLRYGPAILSGVGAISGIYLNNHYRTKLRLGDYGRLSSYLPIVALPAISASMVHNIVIQSEIMLHKQPCAMCTQMRAGLIQAGLSVAYPFVLAPIASFMYASRHFTYKIPFLHEQPKEVFKIWMKMTRPITTPVTVLLFANYILGMFVTYREIIDFHNIMTKLEKRLDKVENQSS